MTDFENLFNQGGADSKYPASEDLDVTSIEKWSIGRLAMSDLSCRAEIACIDIEVKTARCGLRAGCHVANGVEVEVSSASARVSP